MSSFQQKIKKHAKKQERLPCSQETEEININCPQGNPDFELTRQKTLKQLS